MSFSRERFHVVTYQQRILRSGFFASFRQTLFRFCRYEIMAKFLFGGGRALCVANNIQIRKRDIAVFFNILQSTEYLATNITIKKKKEYYKR